MVLWLKDHNMTLDDWIYLGWFLLIVGIAMILISLSKRMIQRYYKSLFYFLFIPIALPFKLSFKILDYFKTKNRGNHSARKAIPQNIKDKVWNRDAGKCVQCGSNQKLEFDHIIPHSKGGADTYRNIQLLCEPCNRSKSAKIG